MPVCAEKQVQQAQNFSLGDFKIISQPETFPPAPREWRQSHSSKGLTWNETRLLDLMWSGCSGGREDCHFAREGVDELKKKPLFDILLFCLDRVCPREGGLANTFVSTLVFSNSFGRPTKSVRRLPANPFADAAAIERLLPQRDLRGRARTCGSRSEGRAPAWSELFGLGAGNLVFFQPALASSPLHPVTQVW